MDSLLDSNAVIYAVRRQPPEYAAYATERLCYVSLVSKVETLGYHRIEEEERRRLVRFFAAANRLPITLTVVDRAVALRQRRRMSLGDSLIAATALVHGLRLVTRNTADFRRVDDLELLDPSLDPWPAAETED